MDILTMSHICVIQNLQHHIDPSIVMGYDALEKMTAEELEKLRDRLIPLYNDVVRERQCIM